MGCLKPQAIEQIQDMQQSQQQTKEGPQDSNAAVLSAEANSSPNRKRYRDEDAPGSANANSNSTPENLYAKIYDNGDSYTKLRPGAFEMLEALRTRCELRIFTMGNPQYACAMASLLDSTGALFRNRIVARDDADPEWRCKGLLKAGGMPEITAVIDDTVGATHLRHPPLKKAPSSSTYKQRQ